MTDVTTPRIVATALELVLAHGIRKTTMDEVASQAGVTRVTAYRHFRDKEELVRAAFLHIVAGIEKVNEGFEAQPSGDIAKYLSSLGQFFATLPRGDLTAREQELAVVYPAVSKDFRKRRHAAIHRMFRLMLQVADDQGLVREDLHLRVVEAYFEAAVINVMEHPSMVSLDLSAAEIYATAASIFLHGIFKDAPRGETALSMN